MGRAILGRAIARRCGLHTGAKTKETAIAAERILEIKLTARRKDCEQQADSIAMQDFDHAPESDWKITPPLSRAPKRTKWKILCNTRLSCCRSGWPSSGVLRASATGS